MSSSLRGNFAIASRPFFSRTDAFGRAPPREEPGAIKSRRSSSVSSSSTTRSAAADNFGRSTSGGTPSTAEARRNVGRCDKDQPSCRAGSSEKRSGFCSQDLSYPNDALSLFRECAPKAAPPDEARRPGRRMRARFFPLTAACRGLTPVANALRQLLLLQAQSDTVGARIG